MTLRVRLTLVIVLAVAVVLLASGVGLHLLTGAVVVEDRPPHLESSAAFWRELFLADGGLGVQNLLQELGTPEMPPFLEWTKEHDPVSTSEYIRLLARWNRLRSESLTFLEDYDAIVCPVTPMPATLHDEPTPLTTPISTTCWDGRLPWCVVVPRRKGCL